LGVRKRRPGRSSSLPARPEGDAGLVERLRGGDPEAGHAFFREHYPSVYRYLLWLTGRPDQAEDLAQETFVRAWQSLHRFDDRWPLRPWLHRIAYREFLHALRGRREEASLDAIAEVGAAETTAWTEAVELREIIGKLPIQQASVVALHYLEGYSSEEIARIVELPAGTVRHRLSEGRAHLYRELGEDDLSYLNEPLSPIRQWAWLPLDQMHALEMRLTVMGVQAFGRSGVQDPTTAGRPLPDLNARTPERLNAESAAPKENDMERREFLRQAAVGAAGLMLSEKPEKEIVDERLTRKVTLAFKGTALADVCEHLREETGIHLVAGNSVADEKVTLFCQKLPLREVMRQLSRPFGYAWLRSGAQGAYRYELAQDLKGQLMEEELRNRDRNAALIALDQEMERYRAYLSLSPDEALARAKTAPAEEKKRLEHLSGAGWGPIQMHFRLTAQEQAALRAGQELKFSQGEQSGDKNAAQAKELPPDIARGVLQARREMRILRETGDPGKSDPGQEEVKIRVLPPEEPGGVPPSAIPEARAAVSLQLEQTELGRFGFSGSSTVFVHGWANGSGTGPYAIGVSPAVQQPENARWKARLTGDPALRVRINVRPEPSCGVDPIPSPRQGEVASAEPKVTSADVLEALHRATGMPIVADFYTRLYSLESVSLTDRTLFEALNHLADAMRLRWNKEASSTASADPRSAGTWLQFRSLSFYNDRPKEVPNRLLTRWAAGRREHGALTLDDLIEIAGLPDPPLDAREMSEGAQLCWGLKEWDLACNQALRPHLRWMASFTSSERQKLQQTPGLRYPELTLAQQQRFFAMATDSDFNAVDSLEEMETATMQVDYSLPGGFEWKTPEKDGPPEPLAPVRAATREAALAAARRVDPQADATQIQPTQLAFVLYYRWGTPQVNGHRRITTHRRGDTSISSGRSKNTP
jgi:RNA polymerase sigma-70 factor, ECF subfamily